MQGILTSPLLNLIHEKQLADEQVLEAIQGEHNLNGELIYGLVHNHGVLDLAAQLALMAEYLGTDVIDVTEIDYTEELLALIPLETAHNYKCLPIGLAGEILHLSMVDPLNPTLLDELSFHLKRPVQIRIGSPEAIQALIDDKYSKDDSMEDLVEALSHVNIDDDEDEEESESLEILEEVGDASPIVRFVNMVLYQALKDQAADVHFEPFEDNYQIRMKVGGAMKILTPPPKELAPAIASRLKIMAGLNITERRLPQDGRIAEIIAGEELVFRMSTLPTKFGESVALRLLDSKNQELVALDALNIPERVDASIRHCVNQPNGVFLVTGPTGSGKTTTLYACLRMLNTIEVKILTCEDPVEFPVEGIIQCQINDKQGFTFVRALRSFLRQDPDIILVGEMRDLETSSIAIEAALTGHLVVSTLHTNSSTEAVTRMVDMGLEPFMIASSVNGVLAQRLVRTICPKCRVSLPMTKNQMDMMELTKEEVGGREIHYGTGCDACGGTGYKSLRGIFEMLQMDDEVRELIATNTPALLLRQKCIETGMQTLRMDGLRLMFSGVSTFEEVMKYS